MRTGEKNAAYMREYRQRNKDRYNAYCREWYRNLTPEQKDQRRTYMREYQRQKKRAADDCRNRLERLRDAWEELKARMREAEADPQAWDEVRPFVELMETMEERMEAGE